MTTERPELVPILMYHSVAATAHDLDLPFTVTPDDFRSHVDTLAAWGARTLTVSDYAVARREHRPLDPRTVVITVDDGYLDTGEVIAPTLADAGMTATVFVTTSAIGGRTRDSQMVTWAQLAELGDAGFEVGSHGHNHVALDIVPERTAREEFHRSRSTLQDGLDLPVLSFAYPHGYYTRRLARCAEEAGYTSACAARNGLSHPGDHPFALSRVVVPRGLSAAELLAIVDGRSVQPALAERSVQRAAWRAARRASSWVGATSVRPPVPVFSRPPRHEFDATQLES